MSEAQTVTVHGPTTKHTSGSFGEEGCGESLHVTFDGEEIFVPYTGVKRHAYDFHGDVPREFDVDRIILYDGRLHAESDTEGGVVELMPNYNSATSEFKGYGRWELKMFPEGEEQEGEVVFARS